jgi:hypothetical protein
MRELHTKGFESVLHTIHCKPARVVKFSTLHLVVQDEHCMVLCHDVNFAELSQAADCLNHNTNNACVITLPESILDLKSILIRPYN